MPARRPAAGRRGRHGVRTQGSCRSGNTNAKCRNSGRQREPRHHVRPFEEVVEMVVPPARRERQHAEERHRQPEEMQRRRIVRPPQPDGRADADRQNADERDRVVQPGARQRHRLQPDLDRHVGRCAMYDVAKYAAVLGRRGAWPARRRRTRPPRPLMVSSRSPGARPARRPALGLATSTRHDVRALLAPQDAVFGLAFPGLDERHVDDRQAHQGRGDGDRKRHAQQRSETEERRHRNLD